MTKQSITIGLALLVAAMPFLGFSSDIKDIYYVVAGIVIASLIHLLSIEYCHICKTKIEKGEEDNFDEVKETKDSIDNNETTKDNSTIDEEVEKLKDVQEDVEVKQENSNESETYEERQR